MTDQDKQSVKQYKMDLRKYQKELEKLLSFRATYGFPAADAPSKNARIVHLEWMIRSTEEIIQILSR